MGSVRFSFCLSTTTACGSGGHMTLQSSKRGGVMPRGRGNVRFNHCLRVIRAVQFSKAKSQTVPAAASGGHMKKSGSLYEVLGVSKGASAQDIKSAYRKLARQFHPDSAASPQAKSLRTQIFLQIHNAYAILSEPEDRAQYDRQLLMSQNWNRASSGGAYRYPPGRVVRNWETDQCW